MTKGVQSGEGLKNVISFFYHVEQRREPFWVRKPKKPSDKVREPKSKRQKLRDKRWESQKINVFNAFS